MIDGGEQVEGNIAVPQGQIFRRVEQVARVSAGQITERAAQDKGIGMPGAALPEQRKLLRRGLHAALLQQGCSLRDAQPRNEVGAHARLILFARVVLRKGRAIAGEQHAAGPQIGLQHIQQQRNGSALLVDGDGIFSESQPLIEMVEHDQGRFLRAAQGEQEQGNLLFRLEKKEGRVARAEDAEDGGDGVGQGGMRAESKPDHMARGRLSAARHRLQAAIQQRRQRRFACPGIPAQHQRTDLRAIEQVQRRVHLVRPLHYVPALCRRCRSRNTVERGAVSVRRPAARGGPAIYVALACPASVGGQGVRV